ADFGLRMPAVTVAFITFTNAAMEYLWLIPLSILASAALAGILLASTTVRWFFPIVGRYYRSQVRSRVLSMLSLLLEGHTPAPQALALLAAHPSLGGTPSRRLTSARFRVERGEPILDSLQRTGLLAASAVPFARAAERAQTLPWALRQLADALAGR